MLLGNYGIVVLVVFLLMVWWRMVFVVSKMYHEMKWDLLRKQKG